MRKGILNIEHQISNTEVSPELHYSTFNISYSILFSNFITRIKTGL